MTVITQADFISSVAGALQYISYYHPVDYITSLTKAYEREQSPAVRDEVAGPAGPTTATRMDRFTRQMLAETGLLGMVGKAERGPEAIAAIREFGAVYLMAVGGAANLVAFGDLGMEAIYEFDVKDMPVTVGVDSKGTSVHETGPAEWQQRIAGIPILQ